jgi:hypothetical protein
MGILRRGRHSVDVPTGTFHGVDLQHQAVVGVAAESRYLLVAIFAGHAVAGRDSSRKSPRCARCAACGSVSPGRNKAETEKACQMLVAVHTSGRTMTCQQPLNDIARRVIQSLPGAMVGSTTMEHAMLDTAYAEPSALAARMSLNTRHFVAHETGVAGIFEYLATEARSVKARAASSPAGKPGNLSACALIASAQSARSRVRRRSGLCAAHRTPGMERCR